MPIRLPRHSESWMIRLPLALVPEYPRALFSATTLRITALHGLHWPM